MARIESVSDATVRTVRVLLGLAELRKLGEGETVIIFGDDMKLLVKIEAPGPHVEVEEKDT